MSKFTPGQWLDLAAAVGLAAYATLIVLVPSLAPLGDTFASATAAGIAAGAAFTRFANSLRSLATFAFLAFLALPNTACATVTSSTAALQRAVDASRAALEGVQSRDAAAAREILGRMSDDLDELETIAPAVDADIAERREVFGQ